MKLTRHSFWWAGLAFLTLGYARVDAAPIYFETQALGGSSWQYNYTLANEELGIPIYEFTIYFDLELYRNLSLATVPDPWDPFVAQPDPNLPDNGFFDALTLSGGLEPGGSLSGFSIRFDYLGTGTPGSQRFEIIDPMTFNTLFAGQTTPLLIPQEPPVGVPEPSSVALFGLALLAMRLVPRRVIGASPASNV